MHSLAVWKRPVVSRPRVLGLLRAHSPASDPLVMQVVEQISNTEQLLLVHNSCPLPRLEEVAVEPVLHLLAFHAVPGSGKSCSSRGGCAQHGA